jgi:cation diffusion facilitator family transporter
MAFAFSWSFAGISARPSAKRVNMISLRRKAPSKESQKITIAGIVLNLFLFIAKYTVGVLTGSLAVLSDAFNSLTDVVSSVLIFWGVKIANKRPDKHHPFGHHRAEPLVGVIVAIFAVVLGFEVLRSAIEHLLEPTPITLGQAAIVVLILTIIIKLLMALYFLKKGHALNSPAIRASGVDSLNDVFVSGVALLGVITSLLGFPVIDVIAAILISLFIFYSAYELGIENIDYLMGRAPDDATIQEIEDAVSHIKHIKSIKRASAHYVGNFIHIEIHVGVSSHISLRQAEKISRKAQHAVEAMPQVDHAFIHVEPD